MSDCKLLYSSERGGEGLRAHDFCFCKTKQKNRSKSYSHLIMPRANWQEPTSKCAATGSRVVSAGGRVVREAGLEESTEGGEKYQNQSGDCQRLDVFCCSAVRRRMTRRVPPRGQRKRIPTWVHLLGDVEPPRTIFEDERKFALFYEASSLSKDLA